MLRRGRQQRRQFLMQARQHRSPGGALSQPGMQSSQCCIAARQVDATIGQVLQFLLQFEEFGYFHDLTPPA
jgi:hypothetical protein